MCIIIHIPFTPVNNFLNIFSKKVTFLWFYNKYTAYIQIFGDFMQNNKPINRFIIYLVVFCSQIVQLYLPRQNDLGEFPPSQVYLLSNRVDLDHTQLILFGAQE